MSSLGSTITDEEGRYRFLVPSGTTVGFDAYHPHYVGPAFGCKEDGDGLIAPVTMVPAGRIVGVVTDAAAGEPVANAQLIAQLLDHSPGHILGGNFGSATSDAEGRFEVGSLASGVYNLLLRTAPGGKHLTARAVEGVRVEAGQDTHADVQVIAGRRIHGVAVDAKSGKPLAGVRVSYYSTSHPQSGAACQGDDTDEQGRFEGYVPPGPAYVYISSIPYPGEGSSRHLVVREDRDLDPIELKGGGDSPQEMFAIPAKDARRLAVPMGRPLVPDIDGGNRTVTGHVKDEDGRPIPGLEVVYPAHPEAVIVATDREGTFIMKGLPDGELPLFISRPGDWQSRTTATVPADSDEIDVTFPIPPQPEGDQ